MDLELLPPAVGVTTLRPQSPFPTFRNPAILTLPEALRLTLADPADPLTNPARHLRILRPTLTIQPQLQPNPATVPHRETATNRTQHLPTRLPLLIHLLQPHHPAMALHLEIVTSRATPPPIHQPPFRIHLPLLRLHPATVPHPKAATAQASHLPPIHQPQ